MTSRREVGPHRGQKSKAPVVTCARFDPSGFLRWISPKGSRLVYAMRCPSGDHDGLRARSSFGSAVKPVPSALMTCRIEFLVNASCVPVGDHVGLSSKEPCASSGET